MELYNNIWYLYINDYTCIWCSMFSCKWNNLYPYTIIHVTLSRLYHAMYLQLCEQSCILNFIRFETEITIIMR